MADGFEDQTESSDVPNGESSPDPSESGVDRLLSRFGPVTDGRTPRRPPGPTPQADGLKRPRRRRDPVLDESILATPDHAERAPIFDQPHDEVFGDAAVGDTVVLVEADPVDVLHQGHGLGDDPDEPVEIIDRRDWVRVPRRTGPTFRLLLVVFVVGLGASFVYGRVTTWFDEQRDPPGPPGEAVEFAIPSGATSNDVTQDLYGADVIANPTLFRYWLSDNFTGEFQAGEYACVKQNMSFDEVLACLDGEGPVPPRFFSVTIPEGLRLDELVRALNRENPAYRTDELLSDLTATLVSPDIGGIPTRMAPGSPDPTGSGKEGLLFPATYQVDERRETDTLDILRRMADTMESKFNQAVDEEGRAPVIDELELTDYEVLIVASLVEEEAITRDDRPRIARVIYNRLLANWSLGIDATACYAAQKQCSELTGEDLASDSAWNTRSENSRGLPPTPIAAPGEASIRAALNPEPGDWMYYVRTEEDGSHTFAVTESDFLAAKAICEERGYC